MDRIVEPPLDEALQRHAPTAHYAVMRNDRVVASCSMWTDGTPTHENRPVGVIGHYAAQDEAAGVAVLRHAVEQLRRRGLSTIVAPMDGSTWRRYRLVTERGAEPPFFLEPDNPDEWGSHFATAGFAPLAHYLSALNGNLAVVDPRHDTALTRLTDAGVRIRALDVSRFEQELTAVHDLSLIAFAHNFLYTPIALSEFLAMYAPLRSHVHPELILLAEEGDSLVGFMFGLPDLAQAHRGEPVTTAIAKTLAVRPDRTGIGLGSVLTGQFQQVARTMGFTRVIHALMHAGNRSLDISSRFGQPFRRYTLYAASLGS
jgi:GNAT superfamily N-acetyltransferase